MKSVVIAIALLFSLTTLSGCSCWTPEKRNDPACAVLHQIIDCTTDVVMSNLGPAVIGMIQTYVSDPNQTPNWDGLVAALEAAGIKDGGCLVAQIQADYLTKPAMGTAYQASATAAKNALSQYKARHKLTGVQYKVKTSSGKIVLL